MGVIAGRIAGYAVGEELMPGEVIGLRGYLDRDAATDAVNRRTVFGHTDQQFKVYALVEVDEP